MLIKLVGLGWVVCVFDNYIDGYKQMKMEIKRREGKKRNRLCMNMIWYR